MSELRVRPSMEDFPVVGEEKQSLAVGIEAASGVDTRREGAEIAKRLVCSAAGELRKNREGLVEQDVRHEGMGVNKKSPDKTSGDRLNTSENRLRLSSDLRLARLPPSSHLPPWTLMNRQTRATRSSC